MTPTQLPPSVPGVPTVDLPPGRTQTAAADRSDFLVSTLMYALFAIGCLGSLVASFGTVTGNQMMGMGGMGSAGSASSVICLLVAWSVYVLSHSTF